jgi:hypothetical protein
MTIAAHMVLQLIVFTSIMVCVFMAQNITQNASDFARGKPLFWLGVAYVVVLNGLALYTTWTVIASLINLTVVLVFPSGLDQTACCLAALTLLVVLKVTWFCLENFVWDRYARLSLLTLYVLYTLLRYILTPYLVGIWASIGICSKKQSDPNVPQVCCR